MLTWKVKQRDTDQLVAMSGMISEQAKLETLADQVQGPVVAFDLGEVTRINSTGVRDWLTLIRALKAKGIEIALERCSVPIVHHLNMISGFEGGGTVRSVFAPYYCAACNREDQQLVSLDAGSEIHIDETRVCPECGGPMEFDDLPEHYERLAREPSRQPS